MMFKRGAGAEVGVSTVRECEMMLRLADLTLVSQKIMNTFDDGAAAEELWMDPLLILCH